MGRRHVNEFRPDEALALIKADREGKLALCPCCGGAPVRRMPRHSDPGHPAERVTLTCAKCGRVVSYVGRGAAEAGREL